MKRLGWLTLAVIAFLAPLSAALGQSSLLQGGAWQPGHGPMYVGSGSGQPIVQDSGPASGGAIGLGYSEQLLTVRGTGTAPYANAGTGPYGTNACNYDAPTTNATGYHYLCFSPNALGGGLIAYGYGGTATPLPLQFNINGVLTSINSSSPTQISVTCQGVDDTALLQGLISATQGNSLGIAARYLGGCNLPTGSAGLSITSSIDFAPAVEYSASGTLSYGSITAAVGVNAITVNTASPVYLHGLFIQYPTQANSGVAAITITASGTSNTNTRINNITVLRADTAIAVLASNQSTISNVVVRSFGTYGISVANTFNVDAGDLNINSVDLVGASGSTAGLYWQSSGGLRFTNSKINSSGSTYGVLINLVNAAITSDVFIIGDSIEGVTGSAVALQRAGTTGTLGNVMINGNELTGVTCVSVPTDANGSWLSVVSISGNTCQLSNSSSAVGFSIDSTAGLALGTNSVISFNSASKKIAIGSAVTSSTVDIPAGSGTFAAWTAASTGVVVRDPFGLPVASLPSTIGNGSQIFATDGAPASSPCTGTSTGSMAFRQNGAWKCF